MGARLDLDSGYLSRLLRQLEADGLVVVGAGHVDRRVRIARLSKKGRVERSLLDRRSDELAWSLVEPLDDEQRACLVEAMGVVEWLLTAGLVSIAIDEPTSEAVRYCFEEYFAELDARVRVWVRFGPARLTPTSSESLVGSSCGAAEGRPRGLRRSEAARQ